MGNRLIAIVFLTSLLVACGDQAASESPQSGPELVDLVVLPIGWTIDGIGELDQDDIPASAHAGLQESLKATIFRPNQPENLTAAARLYVLLYEDTTTAHNAYLEIGTYRITEGAEVDHVDGRLPNEEITFALTNRDATGISYTQSTLFSCRAVVRYDWIIYYDALFTLDERVNAEMMSLSQIREATCDEERNSDLGRNTNCCEPRLGNSSSTPRISKHVILAHFG